MAKRFPTVVYWQLLGDLDPDPDGLLGAKDASTARERGKSYAQLLKLAYPAVKAANPAAWLITGEISDEDFLRGVYDDGAGRCFDILNIRTDTQQATNSFADVGKKYRTIMSGSADDTKPIWTTAFDAATARDTKVFDATQLEGLQKCLDANNTTKLCQKMVACQLQTSSQEGVDFGLVRRDMTLRPAYTWLKDKQINKALLAQPRVTLDVFVPTKTPMLPVGYGYKLTHEGVEILNVVVDSLVPTRITLMHAPGFDEKPGGKPSSPPKRRNNAPGMDPFDI